MLMLGKLGNNTEKNFPYGVVENMSQPSFYLIFFWIHKISNGQLRVCECVQIKVSGS